MRSPRWWSLRHDLTPRQQKIVRLYLDLEVLRETTETDSESSCCCWLATSSASWGDSILTVDIGALQDSTCAWSSSVSIWLLADAGLDVSLARRCKRTSNSAATRLSNLFASASFLLLRASTFNLWLRTSPRVFPKQWTSTNEVARLRNLPLRSDLTMAIRTSKEKRGKHKCYLWYWNSLAGPTTVELGEGMNCSDSKRNVAQTESKRNEALRHRIVWPFSEYSWNSNREKKDTFSWNFQFLCRKLLSGRGVRPAEPTEIELFLWSWKIEEKFISLTWTFGHMITSWAVECANCIKFSLYFQSAITLISSKCSTFGGYSALLLAQVNHASFWHIHHLLDIVTPSFRSISLFPCRNFSYAVRWLCSSLTASSESSWPTSGSLHSLVSYSACWARLHYGISVDATDPIRIVGVDGWRQLAGILIYCMYAIDSAARGSVEFLSTSRRIPVQNKFLAKLMKQKFFASTHDA